MAPANAAADSGRSLVDQAVAPDAAAEYYRALLQRLGAADRLECRADAGGGKGKGLFATRSIKQGEVVLTERPLVGTQELHSKLEVTTCAQCFTAVGTVEQALGGLLCGVIQELSEAGQDDASLMEVQECVDKLHAAVDSRLLEGLLSSSVQLPLTGKLGIPAEPVRCRGGCADEYCSSACEAAAWERHHCLLCPGTATASSSSSNTHTGGSNGAGSSSKGRGGSSRAAPKTECLHGVTVDRARLAAFHEHADESNDIFKVAAQVIATTLITADRLLAEQQADAGEGAQAIAAYGRAVAAAAGTRAAQWVLAAAPGPSAAGGSSQPPDGAPPEQEVATAAFGAAAAAAAAASGGSSVVAVPAAAGEAGAQQQQQQQQPTPAQCWAALQAAFLPFALGHKAPWWEVAARGHGDAAQEDDDGAGTSDDSSSSSSLDAAELAAQLQELAADSLRLLAAGLQDPRFPQLFDLQLYGALVGMFELNNLALTVPAPVARYKALLLAADPAAAAACGGGCSAAEAAAALDEVRPLLDAVGERADEPAEGTGFFAVQSTINHSCAPNAAAACLPGGEMVITALADIPAGGEVLLSYIDEEGSSLAERRAALRDYGFDCRCARCEAEALAGGLQQL